MEKPGRLSDTVRVGRILTKRRWGERRKSREEAKKNAAGQSQKSDATGDQERPSRRTPIDEDQ